MKYHGLLLGVSAGANALAIAEATKRRDAGYMYQPDPTPIVGISDLRHLALGKRQETTAVASTFTLVVSPDSTCGFLSGSPGNAITCGNGDKCSWELRYATAIFCGTQAYNRCLERDDALDTKLCNDVCQSNQYNLLCTNTASPYCGTYNYPSGVVGFRCATASVTAAQDVEFTYTSQKGRSFSTTMVSDETTSSIPSSSEPGSSSTEEPSSTTSEAEPTESDSGGGGSSTPVGAIVGGSIGGFVALSLVVLGAFWLWRKNKNKNAAQPSPQQPPVTAASSMPPPGPYGDTVPPMAQHYPKSDVTSPTQSEWRESMITAQTATTPVQNQAWGQYPQGSPYPPQAQPQELHPQGNQGLQDGQVHEMPSDTNYHR
ncbi:uncharacterized protein FTJAE_11827 [Fusarium tjaetaba]|uniref:Uncharacterized protein n=1 Tax=Fusarium tjaetaba TaxID=1567544 RepID=A0A8H5VF71_9HYPO|nr:uncharacterized protein FTJAE_11827 [Fusarium tjaetaba]KAF5619865.1 hypothetical protein FTJAE_11827 [Fusarium tjaetaba]